jgi:DNA-binding SARP family transcriptional activator
MNNSHGMLNIKLLGPLYAQLNGRTVAVSAPKQRQVLALLALNIGRVVTVSTLTEELWGDTPPRSYGTTLQTYVLQLRNALASVTSGNVVARSILSTRHSGYLLEESVCRIDVEEASSLALAGRMAMECHDYTAASEQLTRALDMWRGPALVDVRMGRVLELEAAVLEQTKIGVFERRVEADLALGRHIDLLGELTLAAARNAMNENLCALLMITLYRTGYVGRSLEAFHRIRSVLAEDLGVEPSPRLQRLQRAILSGDPAIESGPWLQGERHSMIASP